MSPDISKLNANSIVKPLFTRMDESFDMNQSIAIGLDEIDAVCNEVFSPQHKSNINGERRLARQILDILNGEGQPSIHDKDITFTMDDEGVHVEERCLDPKIFNSVPKSEHTNFFEETDKYITNLGYSWEEIDWIGSTDFIIPLDVFISVAKETVYDNAYGPQYIAKDLVIVFKDGLWLSRDEYDGYECWDFNEIPLKPTVSAKHVILSSQDRPFSDLSELCN